MKFLLVGITGKMGTGKSLFSSFLRKRGIPVYSSDKRGTILMNTINVIKKNIIKYFGENSYYKKEKEGEKKINKYYLSKIVFNDPNALKLLCSIIHPWISIDFKKWIFSIIQQNKILPFLFIKESALLFESGSYKECNFIINIISPKKKMIKRIIKRDNLKEYQIINRLKNQISNKKRKEKSNIIIRNYSSIDYLQNQENKIFKFLEKLYTNQYGKRR
ncbi:dephospho-CoA kinase [Blattabacterium cuenoti]|uniref:dephospho-CoA kinase n=1 Tax=Blattabacterium cuenoti TaxID=1653831 RepID=UPI00163B9F32|nr:dephospho-CoA kinase [Blattabacterium cuenoti]